jgi:hypothetical protein
MVRADAAESLEVAEKDFKATYMEVVGTSM